MLPSIEEKPAAAVAGWVSGRAFAFGAWVLVVEFGPGFDGSVFADACTARHLLPMLARRVTPLAPSLTPIVAAFEWRIISC